MRSPDFLSTHVTLMARFITLDEGFQVVASSVCDTENALNKMAEEAKGTEKPREADCRASCTIWKVEEGSRSVTCEFKLEFTWDAGSLHAVDPKRFHQDGSWLPKVDFANAIEVTPLEETYLKAENYRAAILSWRIRVTAMMNLESFPFDSQVVRVLFHVNCSLAPTPKYHESCPLREHGEFHALNVTTQPSPTWDLGPHEIDFEVNRTLGTTYCTFLVVVRRRPDHFMANLFFVLFVLQFCDLAILLLPRKLETRLSPAITLLLASVTFKLSVGAYCPRSDRLTWLDTLLLLAFAFQFLVLGESVLVSKVSFFKNCKRRANNLELAVGCGILVAWILSYCAMLLVWLYRYCLRPLSTAQEARDYLKNRFGRGK